MPLDHNPVLEGNYGPVDREVVATDLKVIGEVPRDLNGLYVRNGPNRKYAHNGRYHWFDGDGMMHAARFENGKVSYRNRWVRTGGLQDEMQAGRALWPGVMEPPRADRPDEPLKNTANTDVKFHNGRLVAMWYLAGKPYHVDARTLETIGPAPFGARDSGTISAHSKTDEATGEFLFFDYGKKHPFMSFGTVGADGEMKQWRPVELPGPRLPHDMAFTENYAILHDLPLFYDAEALKAGRHKIKFHPDIPARFALVPRRGDGAVRWFEAKPCFLYHVVNAWEEGDEVVMIGTPFRDMVDRAGRLDADRLAKMVAHLEIDAILYEWRFDLKTGRTRERPLDDVLCTEFPMIASAYQGRKNRYSYNLMMTRHSPDLPRFNGLVKYDLQTGAFQAWSEGPHFWYSEAPFAPADDAKAEDDGYLVSFVWNPAEERSELQVFDARALAQGPLARVLMPQRVPNGFHATWVSAARLASGR